MRNKYKIEKKSDAELAREDAAAKAGDIRDSVADKADDLKKGAAAGLAAMTGKAADTRDDVADKARAAKSDFDKDSFLDDVLPKVLELLAGAAAAGTAAKTLRSDSAPATTGTYAGYTGAQHATHTGGDVKGAQQHDDYTKMLMDAAKVAASFFAAKKATSVATDKASDADLGSKFSDLSDKVQDKVSDMDLGKKVAGAALVKKASDKMNDEDLDAKELAKRAAAAGVTAKELEKARKKQDKKGGLGLITLGLLASAAAVAAVIYKQTAPQDDPWATPLADPYNGPQSSTIDTGAAGAYTTSQGEPVTSDREVGDPLSAVSTEPVILDAKDQEEYASSTPSDATGFDRTDDGAGQFTDHNAGTERPDRDKY